MTKTKFESVLHELSNKLSSPPKQFLLVDSASQRMHFVGENRIMRTFIISTSRWGTGNREGSFQTPPGVHSVEEKIGTGAPPEEYLKAVAIPEQTGMKA